MREALLSMPEARLLGFVAAKSVAIGSAEQAAKPWLLYRCKNGSVNGAPGDVVGGRYRTRRDVLNELAERLMDRAGNGSGYERSMLTAQQAAFWSQLRSRVLIGLDHFAHDAGYKSYAAQWDAEAQAAR